MNDQQKRIAELEATLQAIANDCQQIVDGDDMSGMSDAEIFGAFLETINAVLNHKASEVTR